MPADDKTKNAIELVSIDNPSSTQASTSNSNLVPADEAVVATNITLGKGIFFLYYGGLAWSQPFWTVFLRSRGFSPTAIGLIVAVFPMATLVTLPPLAFLADWKHCGMQILFVGLVLSGLAAYLGAIFSPDLDAGETSAPIVGTYTVGMFAAAAGVAVQGLASAPLGSFVDHHTMSLLPSERKAEWAGLRAFGAYGWGLVAPLSSLVTEYYGYTYSFVGYLLTNLVTCVLVYKSRIVKPEPTELNFIGVLKFLGRREQRRVLLMLIACSIMGMGMAVISMFLFMYLEELQAPKVLLGISITITVVTEIPIFHHSEAFYKRFTPQQMIALAMVGWSIRSALYSLMTNPWMVLAIEPFHGVTFGLAWLAGVKTVTSSFPPDLATSSFGSLHASVFGFGYLIGMTVGGVGYDALGATRFFAVCALLMTAAAVVFTAVDWLLTRDTTELTSIDATPTSVTPTPAEHSSKEGAKDDAFPTIAVGYKLAMQTEAPRRLSEEN